MSHDTDKLIRQLSLVAFLMAERRPLTARDVKGNVEGYSEMSDEAFARRFYSDRAELTALGVPLTSQRDEFTGEELYTLRSEHYFLDQLDLDEDELAALQTALYTLEGKFAYAEPLRLALQNLALGRPGFRHAPTATAERVRVTAPDYSPELGAPALEARVGDLEAADDPVPLLVAGTRPRDRASPQPVRAPARRRRLVRDRPRPRPRRDAHVPRRADPRRTSGSQRVASGTSGCRPTSTSTRTASRAHGRSANRSASRASRCRGTRPGGCTGRSQMPARSTDGVFETPFATLGPLVSWILRQNGRAVPLEPAELRDEVGDALRLLRERHTGACAGDGARTSDRVACPPPSASPPVPSRPSGSASSRRCSRTCSLPAATSARRTLDATEVAERFSLPREELQETLSLLNLVNFGGGLLHGLRRGRRRDRSRPGRQGALRRRLPQGAEADAARGAGDPARDRVRRPDDRGRRAHAARTRASQARGDVRPVRARTGPRRRGRGTTRRRSCARSPTAPRSGGSSSSST